MIRKFGKNAPRIDPTAYIANTAEVIGDVEIGRECSIWPGVVLRGDVEPIKIGDRTNIQDNSVVHTREGHPTIIGSNCTVGHSAIIHGTHIGDSCLIGMGSITLEATIENDCLVGAAALVPAGAKIPRGSLALGIPAKVIRQLSPAEITSNQKSAEEYATLAAQYRKTSGKSPKD